MTWAGAVTTRPARGNTRGSLAMRGNCTPVPLSADVAARFWAKVVILDPGECWPWQGAIDTPGYGAFKAGGRKVNSHRMAYELTHGTIAPGLLVLHSCDNRLCCNPSHLRTGTTVDNIADAKERGRWRVGEMIPRSKLNCARVAEMKRERSERGAYYADIAARHGVHENTARSAIIGESWRCCGERIALAPNRD